MRIGARVILKHGMHAYFILPACLPACHFEKRPVYLYGAICNKCTCMFRADKFPQLTCRRLLVIAVSIITYVGSMVVIVLMSLWYTGCWINIMFIGTTLLLLCIMPLMAMIMRSKVFYLVHTLDRML